MGVHVPSSILLFHSSQIIQTRIPREACLILLFALLPPRQSPRIALLMEDMLLDVCNQFLIDRAREERSKGNRRTDGYETFHSLGRKHKMNRFGENEAYLLYEVFPKPPTIG